MAQEKDPGRGVKRVEDLTEAQRSALGVTTRRTQRINVRFHPDSLERAKYWAEKEGISVSEFVAEAVDFRIAWMNQDYPLPTMEQQRLNEIIGHMVSMVEGQRNLEAVVVGLADGFERLARSDSPLLDDDDGELGKASSASAFTDDGEV